MFYSQDLLQKRGGKFSKIWLAATRMSKLARRDVAGINVPRCCSDIIDYIDHNVSPVRRGGKRPRFSLYLSALLMYGCTRVHLKHCEYLLSDTTTMFVKVNAIPKDGTDIDLKLLPRADLVTLTTDMLSMTADEGLQMITEELENLHSLPVAKGEFWNMDLQITSPEVSSGGTRPSKKGNRKRKQEESVANQEGPTVSSIDEITLKEPEPVFTTDRVLSPKPVPWEEELPMMNVQDMSLLMGMGFDEQPLQAKDLLPTSSPLTAEDRTLRRCRLWSEQQNSMDMTLPQPEILEETPLRAVADPMLGVPEARAQVLSPGVTQQIITSPLPRRHLPRESLELMLTPVAPSPGSRRRRKQLAFADKETQISKNKMKENMTNSKNTSQPFVLQDMNGQDANNLLSRPGNKALCREPWMSMWLRNAHHRRGIPESELAHAITPPRSLASDHMDQQIPVPEQPGQAPTDPLLTIPDIEMPRILDIEMPGLGLNETLQQPLLSPVLPSTNERSSRRGRKRTSNLEQSIEEMRKIVSFSEKSISKELSVSNIDIEQGRDATLSNLDGVSLEQPLLLDDSRESRRPKRRRTRSSVETEQPVAQKMPSFTTSFHTSGSSHALYGVIEEPQYTSVSIIEEPVLLDISHENLLLAIEGQLYSEGEDYVTFRSVCPPELTDRNTAAKQFSALLDLCAKQKVSAHQDECYGEIFLTIPNAE